MRIDPFSRTYSLRSRLIWTYLIILGIGGLATSSVGSWIVSSTIMLQASRTVDHSLATARAVYEEHLRSLETAVRIAASGTTITRYQEADDRSSLLAYLEETRRTGGLDFLTFVDASGRVVMRSVNPARAGDDLSSWILLRAALDGKTAAATEIVSAAFLASENPAFAERAHFRAVETPRAGPPGPAEETSGMVLAAAAPVRGGGALYGGVLLSRNFSLVDRVWEMVFKGERYENRDAGTVTLFQNDLRISTNVKNDAGERALGTRVSEEVNRAVLGRGESWRGRAFVVSDWYISGYEPIRDYSGKVVGMLYVGLLETAFASLRDRVILSFFGIATTGFLLILAVTYYMIGNITRPIREMVAATRGIAAGRFDQEIPTGGQGEMAVLADSFSAMLKSLRQMKADLEEWGRTLEQKVHEQSRKVVELHDRVAESERLASVGKLAAGVAHEINNPLGAILSLTALTLEDKPQGDPDRENLEEVVRQSQRCRNIVRGLLEFSRQSNPNPERVDLNRIVQDTLGLLSKQALFLNVNVEEECAPDLPPVMADRSQMQQVFMNILINAVQAMEEKGTVRIATRSAAGGVEVSISDTGCGIPPEKIGRVFDPFFTSKSRGEGTGLGLSIAYGIVTKHGGDISVESEPGKGSTFTVRLPVAPALAQMA
ncbi:MAG: cache domain-containing protein [Bryobacteraceae bacterium]